MADKKKEKYFDVDAMLDEEGGKGGAFNEKESVSSNRQRTRRPTPAISAMNGDNKPVSVTESLKEEKHRLEKTLETERRERQEEKKGLSKALNEAKAQAAATDGNAPIVLTMPVTKQEVRFELKLIDPELIDVSPLNERKQEFLDELSLQDLLPSIRKEKQQKPGTLRPKPGGKYELIEGSRRLAAVRIAGHEYLGLVGDVPDADVYSLSVIENKHQDVSPYEKALAYNRQIEDKLYDSWNQLGVVHGISSSHIARYKACIELDEVFVRILRCPSDMPLSYGETIRGLRKKNEKRLLSKAEELLVNRNDAASMKDGIELLDVDVIIKELKSSVRVKATQPKSWKPVVYKSKDKGVSLKHSVSSKGATKFELAGVDDGTVNQLLEHLKGVLKVKE